MNGHDIGGRRPSRLAMQPSMRRLRRLACVGEHLRVTDRE
jgi:hypothetical protein